MRSDVALLWDESFLWGLTAFKALREYGLGFSLMNSGDVRSGKLRDFRMLFVPGGWASNKLKALGEQGEENIREFVSEGGTYMGVCGGAGLAVSDGIGLLDIKRKPLKERVPSLSGRVRTGLAPHYLWQGIKDPVFHIWWPSQFIAEDGSAHILASFESAAGDAFSSDLNVGDTGPFGWDSFEKMYGLNLDPEKMVGDPLVIEGAFGKGKALLSLVHFDTPGDINGSTVLKNIWDYFGLARTNPAGMKTADPSGKLYSLIEEFFAFGKRNFLWYERGPFIQWRRGVRGLEYFTLYTLVRELSSLSSPEDEYGELEEAVYGFVHKAKRLLMRERLALQRGESITFSKTSDPEIMKIRGELFSESKSYGGAFKTLIDGVDAALYEKLKAL